MDDRNGMTVLMLDHDRDTAERLLSINESLNVVCVAADQIGVAISELRQSIEFSVMSLQDYAREIVIKGPTKPAWRNLQRGRWAR